MPYRAGINIETTGGRAVLMAKLKADPAMLAAAKQERDYLAAQDAQGKVFQRCYVSKTVHGALCAVLAMVEESGHDVPASS
jgi:hypothetical protein